MGWRSQHNRELAAEEKERAWWASLTPAERWRIRVDRYGPLVGGAVVAVSLIWWFS